MRKVQKLILVLLLIMVPCFVLAIEDGSKKGTVVMQCTPSTVQAGAQVSCKITANSDINVTSFELKFSLSDGLSIVSYTDNGGWQGNKKEPGKYIIGGYGNEGTGDFALGTLVVKLDGAASAGTYTVSLVDSTFNDVNGNKQTVSNAQSVITVSEEEIKKGLSDLSAPGYTLNPLFTPTKNDYILEIESNTFKISAIPANSNDTVKMYNDKDLNTELNPDNISFDPNGDTMLLRIVVGTGDTETKYVISVKRKQETILDNTLSSLTVGGTKVTLESGKDDYTVYLDDVNNYLVSATLSDEVNFEIDKNNGGVGSYSGETTVYIIVKPKDNSAGVDSRTYSIKIVKKGSTPTPSSSKSDVSQNPQTGNISIFIITLLLIGSLIVSLNLYRKNIEYYK